MPTVMQNPQVDFKPAEPASISPLHESPRVIVKQGFTISQSEISELETKVILTKHVPGQLLQRYMRAAMKKASPRKFSDESWYADIPGFEGVWAKGETLQDCLNELHDVLLDWLLLKIEAEDKDIPPLEDMNLNVL